MAKVLYKGLLSDKVPFRINCTTYKETNENVLKLRSELFSVWASKKVYKEDKEKKKQRERERERERG